jgi:glycerol-3-phosphate O-acyltransferase/dihydroxyacetone phosphate acyltransferase
MDKFWIGLFARAFNSIPVVRPQDLQCSGTGTIFSKDDIPLKLYGVNTKFKKELTKRCYIALPNGESVEVVSIISDNEALLKNQFTNDASVTQLTALDKDGKRSGSSYKITPYVDQSGMFNEVVSRLTKNKAVGIFPEGLFYLILGGSHDRPNMLPLKPGVAMMVYDYNFRRLKQWFVIPNPL